MTYHINTYDDYLRPRLRNTGLTYNIDKVRLAKPSIFSVMSNLDRIR